MCLRKRLIIRLISAIWLLYSAVAAAFEDVPQIHISELIPPSLAQSVSYRVDEGKVTGKYIRFSIDSEFGNFTVDSLPLLMTRIREISILDQAVNQVHLRNKKSGEYKRGEYHVSADSALDIVTRPMSTASEVAGQVRSNLENNDSEVSQEVELKYMTGDDKTVDPVMAMHKRNIASQWGLDVYSSNPMVIKFLNDTASARAAGRIAAGTPGISRGNFSPFKFVNPELELELGLLIKNHSISELEGINNQLLSTMHVPDGLRLLFLHHRNYSPRLKTAIVHYLNLMTGVVNRSAFIEQAMKADSESAALGYEMAAMMLAYYHNKVSPLLKISSGENILQAVTRNNHILYLSMADMIYWSEDTEKYFNQLSRQAKQAGFSTKELMTMGEITDEASARLNDLGFVLRKRMIF